MGRGGAGDEQRQARHDVDGDGRHLGVAVGQGLDQTLGFRIDAEQAASLGLSSFASTSRVGTAICAKDRARLAAK